MASSGKKGKKNKGTVISLQSFLANGDAPSGTTQVSKKIRNVDGDESDDGNNALPLVFQLPTAPRASRIFDDDSIPHKPPFIAYLTNLPFDANEDDIYSFFGALSIKSLRLPREDGETGRVRGFGYAEFETRDDLIQVLSWSDPSIKGRRVRIELSNENDQQQNRQRGNRRGFDGFGNSGENRDSTNWRRDNQNPEAGSGGGGGGGGYERNYDRGDRGYNRERRNVNSEESGGSWRTGNRNVDNSPRRDRGGERHYEGGSRNRNYDREDREQRSYDNEPAQERPKLNLKPRTLPLPEIVTVEEEPKVEEEAPKPPPKVGVAPEKVFGSAKPVDTAARELEMEERLEEQKKLQREKQEEEKLHAKVEEMHIDKTDKENANSVISWRQNKTEDRKISPDRRNDNRRRDNNRDNKDYNSFNKNRDRNERSDLTRDRNVRDKKPRDDTKTKRDVKVERPLPKYQPNQPEPVLQSTNKFLGLDDDDDSE